jgi:hypothetical protein
MNIMNDAQQSTYNFVVNQAYTVNTTIYATQFPDLDFSRLVTVDTSAPEWTPGIITFMSNTSGAAQWFSTGAKDVPKANITVDRGQTAVHTAAIGYGYDLEEIGQAQLLGVGLTTGRALAARRAYQEFMWNITLTGDAAKGLKGLGNQTGIVSTVAPADGTAGVTTWFAADGTPTKTAAQIARDFNNILIGVFVGSLTVEIVDTVIMPYSTLANMAAMQYSPGSDTTLLEFISKNNILTSTRGLPLTIRGELGLDTAGAAGTRRIIAYANREDVTKLHLPMPHRFLPVYQDGPTSFEIPGIFRTGGIEVLRPGAFRYLDGI